MPVRSQFSSAGSAESPKIVASLFMRKVNMAIAEGEASRNSQGNKLQTVQHDEMLENGTHHCEGLHRLKSYQGLVYSKIYSLYTSPAMKNSLGSVLQGACMV